MVVVADQIEYTVNKMSAYRQRLHEKENILRKISEATGQDKIVSLERPKPGM